MDFEDWKYLVFSADENAAPPMINGLRVVTIREAYENAEALYKDDPECFEAFVDRDGATPNNMTMVDVVRTMGGTAYLGRELDNYVQYTIPVPDSYTSTEATAQFIYDLIRAGAKQLGLTEYEDYLKET